MDPLEHAALGRAHAALEVIVKTQSARQKRAALVEIGKAMLLHKDESTVLHVLRASENPLVQKAAVAAETLGGGIFDVPDAQALAASFLASIAEGMLLDQIARYATTLPTTVAQAVVATGFSANTITEGFPKPVRQIPLSLADAEYSKAAGIVVLSNELVRAIGGDAIFEAELTKAITTATNAAVINSLTTSASVISTTGDALNDLRAGLAAADPSLGYVVATSTATATNLATRTENRGAGVRGGAFLPDVQLVTVDSLTAKLVVIPASRISMQAEGLRIARSKVASVSMSDTPTSPSTMVSLFQTNCGALLAERVFRLASSSPCVIVQ